MQGVLREHDVPVGPVQDLHQVFTHPQVIARDVVKTYNHPQVGPVRAIDMPYQFSAAPPRELMPPPALGEHTVDILASRAGLSEAEIDALIQEKVVLAHGRA